MTTRWEPQRFLSQLRGEIDKVCEDFFTGLITAFPVIEGKEMKGG